MPIYRNHALKSPSRSPRRLSTVLPPPLCLIEYRDFFEFIMIDTRPYRSLKAHLLYCTVLPSSAPKDRSRSYMELDIPADAPPCGAQLEIVYNARGLLTELNLTGSGRLYQSYHGGACRLARDFFAALYYLMAADLVDDFFASPAAESAIRRGLLDMRRLNATPSKRMHDFQAAMESDCGTKEDMVYACYWVAELGGETDKQTWKLFSIGTS